MGTLRAKWPIKFEINDRSDSWIGLVCGGPQQTFFKGRANGNKVQLNI